MSKKEPSKPVKEKKHKPEPAQKPKEDRPEGEVAPVSVQPYAAISDILEFAEKKSEGIVHRELSMAYKGIITALKDVESWAKNIADVESDIAKKAKK